MKGPDLSLLVVLDALLQEGSVTRAAARLGLSTPATSHALARLRVQLDDPILVRAGRQMVPTPRAEAIRDRVALAAREATALMTPERAFDPRTEDRVFTMRATDHVLSILGAALDRRLVQGAPNLALRVLPNTPEDPAALRQGAADMAVGIYRELPPELRTRPLFTDRFVCVVREQHPSVGTRLSLSEYVALSHAQIAPRGAPGSYIDSLLAERGKSRRILRAVPYFMSGLALVAASDHVLTISERLAQTFAPQLGLRILEPPLPLAPYTLSLVWHPRHDADAAHRFLRTLLVDSALEAAPDRHADARSKLGRSRPKKKTPRRP